MECTGTGKELANVIARLLSIIFARSWQSRQVPVDWEKKSDITLIYKKGKEDPSNYSQSAQSPGRLWNKSSWKIFRST